MFQNLLENEGDNDCLASPESVKYKQQQTSWLSKDLYAFVLNREAGFIMEILDYLVFIPGFDCCSLVIYVFCHTPSIERAPADGQLTI